MAIVGTDIRPPYVRFEQRAIEDRSQEKVNGRYGFKDVDVALITVPGQKDVVERYVEDWLLDITKQAEDGRVPFEWPIKFREAYEYWKKGQDIPVEGTPIKGWAVISPAIQQTLLQRGILTVEDLAAASDEAIRNIGTGALTFKQKAQAWLKESSDVGSVAAENATLKRDLEAQGELIKSQAEQLAIMREQLDKLLPKKDF